MMEWVALRSNMWQMTMLNDWQLDLLRWAWLLNTFQWNLFVCKRTDSWLLQVGNILSVTMHDNLIFKWYLTFRNWLICKLQYVPNFGSNCPETDYGRHGFCRQQRYSTVPLLFYLVAHQHLSAHTNTSWVVVQMILLSNTDYCKNKKTLQERIWEVYLQQAWNLNRYYA